MTWVHGTVLVATCPSWHSRDCVVVLVGLSLGLKSNEAEFLWRDEDRKVQEVWYLEPNASRTIWEFSPEEWTG